MNANKGTSNEPGGRRLLESGGYAVTRAAGSLGAWDLIAVVGSTDVLFVQLNTPGQLWVE